MKQLDRESETAERTASSIPSENNDRALSKEAQSPRKKLRWQLLKNVTTQSEVCSGVWIVRIPFRHIRALSAASAAKFNIAPVRWQHPSHVAIVPPESKEKREGNDWDTACRNFKT
jgi:hypothetical protein